MKLHGSLLLVPIVAGNVGGFYERGLTRIDRANHGWPISGFLFGNSFPNLSSASPFWDEKPSNLSGSTSTNNAYASWESILQATCVLI